MKAYTILAVDDQPEYLQTYAAYLFEEKVPYKIISAVDGQMALELAASEKPDVIIMDWQMPVMDGLTAVKALKQDEQLKDIPVIMATGIMLNSEDLKEALEAGASDYIRKPIDKIELLARVHSHIRLSEHIQSLKDFNKIIENEKSSKVEQTRQTLRTVCDQMDEMSQFFLKEYEGLLREVKKLNSNHQSHPEIIKHIQNKLISNSNVFKNYVAICQQFKTEDDYIRRLLKRHPDLLPNEIELSLLLKKNTASKDIASMTYRSLNTIKVARSKLRSKLGLQQSDNLVNYLIQQ